MNWFYKSKTKFFFSNKTIWIRKCYLCYNKDKDIDNTVFPFCILYFETLNSKQCLLFEPTIKLL